MSETFHRVLPEDGIDNGQASPAIVNGWPVLVCKYEDQLFAVINRCTHASSALEEGRIRKGTIMCPLHGARFDLATGNCLGGASYRPLKRFEVRVTDGWIEVATPDEKPSAEHMPVTRSAL